jgi:transcriptional regulator with XRE-family HTH domain
MSKRPRFKEWRKKRGLTQEQVVDRLAALDDPNLPQTTASLSRLENGKQIYTQRSLEALAEIYQVDPDDLWQLPPPDETLQKYVRQLDEVGRQRALRILRAMDNAEQQDKEKRA